MASGPQKGLIELTENFGKTSKNEKEMQKISQINN
jgi:hypothetical protein